VLGRYFFEDGENRDPVEFVPEEDPERPTEYLVAGGNPYRRVAPVPHDATNPRSWSRFTGSYRDPSNLGEGAAWRFELNDGELNLSGDWADETCEPLGRGDFLSSIGLLEFDSDGGAVRVGMATRYTRAGEV